MSILIASAPGHCLTPTRSPYFNVTVTSHFHHVVSVVPLLLLCPSLLPPSSNSCSTIQSLGQPPSLGSPGFGYYLKYLPIVNFYSRLLLFLRQLQVLISFACTHHQMKTILIISLRMSFLLENLRSHSLQTGSCFLGAHSLCVFPCRTLFQTLHHILNTRCYCHTCPASLCLFMSGTL